MVGGGGSISVWEGKVHVDTGTWQTHVQFQWGYDLCENRGAEHGARGRVGRIRAAQIYAGLGSISTRICQRRAHSAYARCINMCVGAGARRRSMTPMAHEDHPRRARTDVPLERG